jgi:WD40 repeat protein
LIIILFTLFFMSLTPSPFFVLQSPVSSLAITPDGRWLVSGSLDKSVRIWDTRNATMQCVLATDELAQTVDISPASGYLASGGDGGTVRIWSYSSNKYPWRRSSAWRATKARQGGIVDDASLSSGTWGRGSGRFIQKEQMLAPR